MDAAQPADFEELGVMILASYKGMDITSERLGKEHLARYGLEWGSSDANDSWIHFQSLTLEHEYIGQQDALLQPR